MGIRGFAAFASCVAAFFAVSTASALIYFTSELHRSSASILNAAEHIDVIHEIEAGVLEYSRENLLHAQVGGVERRLRMETIRGNTTAMIEKARRFSGSPMERELIARVEASIEEYWPAKATFEAAGGVPLKVAEALRDLEERIFNDTEELIALNMLKAQRSGWDNKLDNLTSERFTAVFTAILLLGTTLLFLMIRKLIYRPLMRIIDSLDTFRAGRWAEPPATGLAELRRTSETLGAMMKDLRNARQQQMRYLAAVAHDIRNPIGAIKAAAELGAIAEGAGRQFFDVIGRQLNYLDQMVGDLIDTTRAEGGNLKLQQEARDLGELARESVRLFQNYSPAHELELSVPEEPVACLIDALRISQVVNNLISNAIKYSPAGGMVRVEVAKNGRMIELSVSDQGVGMSGDEIAGIFVPFNRSAKTSGSIPGVGLGLFTAKRIIEAHNGTLTVRSFEGRGSTFLIVLPDAVRGVNDRHSAAVSIAALSHITP